MREKIQRIIKECLGADCPASFAVRVPDDEAFGHYATNVAFVAARAGSTGPLQGGQANIPQTARDFAARIAKSAPEGFFDKVEPTPQGFINLWLSPRSFQEEFLSILAERQKHGAVDTLNGRKIQVEFVSANPTGPLTLANGRGGFFGDALANVLANFGAAVEREYYVNDTGNQIVILGKSVLAAIGKIPQEESFYQGLYIKEWAAAHGDEVTRFESDPLRLGQVLAKELLGRIREALDKKAGIRFDRWTSEEDDIHKNGFVEKVLEVLKARGFVYEADGAVWFKTTQFGDDKDRVLVTSDKYPTYFLADAGHFLETKERGFKEKILILGPDHYGYVKRISAAAEVVGLERLEVIVTQAVRLVEGGKEVKMSKRRGEFVALEELIDEVGADVARFFFLQVSPDSHMDFDLGLAKERSAKNPVYYVQYALVRGKGILSCAGATETKGEKAQREIAARLAGENELRLIRSLVQLPDMLRDALDARRVHGLARYATEVARALHAFYERERVIGVPKDVEEARILLVRAAVVVLENILAILNVSKPERM